MRSREIEGKEHIMADMMTVGEAAIYLRVNKKTIYRLLESGKIPATKVGRQYRFSKRSIDEWLQKESVRKASILVIDDEETIRALIKETLGELGHIVTAIGTGNEGLEVIRQQSFDLVFLDLKMPVMDGVEVFRQIKTIRPKLPVVIITGYTESELMSRAMAYGPFAVMAKPFDESNIVMAVDNFLRAYSH